MSCSMTGNYVLDKFGKRKDKGLYVNNHLKKHCIEQSHCFFWFTVTKVYDNDKETTTLFMQRELFKAIKQFGGFIPLHYFNVYVDGTNPMLLIQNIACIMGAAIGGCSSGTSITQMSKRKEMLYSMLAF